MNNPTTQPTVPERWAPRFFTIWSGQAISLFGSSLVQFALVWYLTRETGSATVLATATLFALLPQILLGPIAGTYVDRASRRLVMILADTGIAVATLVLVYLFWSGQIQVWHIYVAVFIRSVGGAFHYPSMSASTSLMVPEKHLARVAGMNQTLHGLVNIIAPPVGALLIEVMPTQGVLMIDIGTALVAVIPLFFFSIPQPVRENVPGNVDTAQPSFFQDLKDGFRYMVSWPGLLGVAIMATLLNFLITPISAMMPLLVTDYFKKGALEFGLIDSFFGVGMILGGVTLGVWGGFKRKIATSLVGVLGFSLGIAAIGFAPPSMFAIALSGMFIIGFLSPIVNGPIMALLQTIVRKDMQGRVLSILVSAASAMMPIGLLIAGPISDWFGIRTWYWVAAIANMLIAVVCFFVPAIMNIETNHNGHSAVVIATPVPSSD